MEGERMIVSHDFESLKTAADPVVDGFILKKIDSYEPILRENARNDNAILRALTSPKAQYIVRASSAEEVKAARARLIEAGLKPQHVNIWSALHVVLLDDVLLYEKYRDEVGKWMNLPYWQAKPGIDEVVAEVPKVRSKSPFKSAFVSLVPGMEKVKQAQARIDQRIAYLQILEAIRLYAYKNGGALPATLAETKLPLPVDPITGKPFEYVVQGDVATLHGANPHPGVDRLNRYYEIRIKK